MKFAARLLLASCLVVAAPPLAQGQVVLIGTITDSLTGQPIANAAVYLPDQTSVSTNRDGIFRLRAPAEQTLLLFRRIGYVPRAIRLNLERRSGQIELGTIQLRAVAVGLDSVTIETRLVERNPRLHEFFRRMKSGRGQYITRQDIYQRNPMLTTDLMRTIPGISIDCPAMDECVPMSFRKVGMGEVRCPMRVLLDGMPIGSSLNLIPPAWIAGIEIYRSTAFTPLELTMGTTTGQGNSGCGVVVVWTGGDEY